MAVTPLWESAVLAGLFGDNAAARLASSSSRTLPRWPQGSHRVTYYVHMKAQAASIARRVYPPLLCLIVTGNL